MQISVQLRDDDKKLLDAMMRKLPGDIRRIRYRAVRDTQHTARKLVRTTVQKDVNVKAGSLNRRIKLTQKASPQMEDPYATVTIQPTRFGAISLRGTRKVKAPSGRKGAHAVRVQAKPKGPKLVVPGAFIAKGRGGRDQVFARAYRGDKSRDQHDLESEIATGEGAIRIGRSPIHRVVHKPLTEFYERESLRVNEAIAKALNKNMIRHIDLVLKKVLK